LKYLPAVSRRGANSTPKLVSVWETRAIVKEAEGVRFESSSTV
jgi:hypothetical protein